MTDDWQKEARAAAAARRTIWIWSPVFMAVGMLAVLGGATTDVAWIRWSGLVCGGALALWGFLYGSVVYMRTVDEQERDANLWGCYAGMCVYLLLFSVTALLDALSMPIPYAQYGVFTISIATVLVVFLWKRFF